MERKKKNIAFARGGNHLPIAHALRLLSIQELRFGLTILNLRKKREKKIWLDNNHFKWVKPKFSINLIMTAAPHCKWNCIVATVSRKHMNCRAYMYNRKKRCFVKAANKRHHIWHIWHVWCSDIHHMYVCQYGCQKKRKDLRNAANHLRYPTKMCLGPTIETSCFLIFHHCFIYWPFTISFFSIRREVGLRS